MNMVIFIFSHTGAQALAVTSVISVEELLETGLQPEFVGLLSELPLLIVQ